MVHSGSRDDFFRPYSSSVMNVFGVTGLYTLDGFVGWIEAW